MIQGNPLKRRVRSAYPGGGTVGMFGRCHLEEDLSSKEVYVGEFTFLIEQARNAGGVVSEFAAGAGRVSMALAKAGFDVWALEASSSMIELAHKAANIHLTPEERQRIHYIQGDMRRAEVPRKVPLVIIPYQSFWFNFAPWSRDRGPDFLGGDPQMHKLFQNFLKLTAKVLKKKRSRKIDPRKFNPGGAFYPGSIAFKELPEGFRRRLMVRRLLQAEYCIRSILRNLTPGGKFVIDTPGHVHCDGECWKDVCESKWWEAMAIVYGFGFEVVEPYGCEDKSHDHGEGCIHRQVLIGRKLS